MRFLAVPPAVAYALLAGVALLIVILYLLRPPSRRIIVASLLLWVSVQRQSRTIDSRRLLLLVLGLVAGLSLALAITRPEVSAFGSGTVRLALILDNSPSMAARMQDGRSRWQRAVEEARVLLERSGAAIEVMLLDTTGRMSWSGFVERNAALAALENLPPPAWGDAHMPPTSILDDAQVHLFTDGVAPVHTPENAVVHPVFEPADNVAVTAFNASPLAQDPTRFEALVQVLNVSPHDLRARLLISGDDDFSITQDLDLGAGETVNATFDISDFAGGVLGAAAIYEHDAYPADDLAFAVVPPHRPRRVLLVTAGNPPLEDALRRLPAVSLAVVAPESYTPAMAHDAVVFDRFAPVEPPAAGALLFRPPARDWFAERSAVLRQPRITDWKQDHAVSGAIEWRKLRLDSAVISNDPDAMSDPLVMAAGSGALVTAGRARARWIQVGFALHDSNFPLQPGFPVFLGTALGWIDPPKTVLSRGLGSVEVALPGAVVHDGSGNPVAASATERGVVFDALHADVFTVSTPDEQTLVTVNVADPRYAQINRSRFSDGNPTSPQQAASVQGKGAELWVLLLLAAALFLLFEWVVFTRPRSA